MIVNNTLLRSAQGPTGFSSNVHEDDLFQRCFYQGLGQETTFPKLKLLNWDTTGLISFRRQPFFEKNSIFTPWHLLNLENTRYYPLEVYTNVSVFKADLMGVRATVGFHDSIYSASLVIHLVWWIPQTSHWQYLILHLLPWPPPFPYIFTAFTASIDRPYLQRFHRLCPSCTWLLSLSARSRHEKKLSGEEPRRNKMPLWRFSSSSPSVFLGVTDELCSPLTPLRPGSGKFLYASLPLPNVSMMIYGIFYRC